MKKYHFIMLFVQFNLNKHNIVKLWLYIKMYRHSLKHISTNYHIIDVKCIRIFLLWPFVRAADVTCINKHMVQEIITLLNIELKYII